MFVIKRDSWHYRLASFGSSTVESVQSFCPYARKVMWGTLRFILAKTLIFGLSIGYILGLLSILKVGFDGDNPFVAFAVTVTVVPIAVLFAVGGVWLTEKYSDYKWRRDYNKKFGDQKERQKGFFTTWAESVHNKFCPKIEFEPKSNSYDEYD